MNELMQAILTAMTIIVTAAVYVFCIKTLLPRLVIKRRYYIEGNLGRGLKKYRSDDGRAVVYEPHPSVRKYIRQYALVNDNGHKYLECQVDRGVNRLIYTVIMLDRYDRVIDVLEIEEVTAKRELTQTVYLHADTSYIALIIGSVNKEKLPNSDVSYYRKRDVGVFGASVFFLTLVAGFVMSYAFEYFLKSIGVARVTSASLLVALLSAVAACVLSIVILLIFCSKKNVRVVK